MADKKRDKDEEQNLENYNVSGFTSGMFVDAAPLLQPQGTQRFVLNGVNQSNEGETNVITNEESNEACYQLPVGYIPLGKCYIGDNETIIFSVKDDETRSEIGIAYNDCRYVTIVNTDTLNFLVTKQIQATYRLRKGCEKTVYWTDNHNPVRVINLEKLDEYKDENGHWEGRRFSLINNYPKIPRYESIKVENSGGTLPVGSYTIAIRYLDENLNPTDWVAHTNNVIIYYDSLSASWKDIAGLEVDNNPADPSHPIINSITSKSIRVELSNMDIMYPLYQVAVSHYTTQTGLITGTVLLFPSGNSINNNVFVVSNIDGSDVAQLDSNELSFNRTVLDKAKTLEQIDNQLVIGNLAGLNSTVKSCNLQRFASKIRTDCTVVTELATNMAIEGNIKSPTHKVADVNQSVGLGYIPGEIYSFGIVYIFDDYTYSPVYHIPGKTEENREATFRPGPETFPMSVGICETSKYPKSSETCSTADLWGIDADGNKLVNTPIRHHRFPLRTDIKKSPMKRLVTSDGIMSGTALEMTVDTTGAINLECGFDSVSGTSYELNNVLVRATYSSNNIVRTLGGNVPTEGITVETFETPVLSNIDLIKVEYYKEVCVDCPCADTDEDCVCPEGEWIEFDQSDVGGDGNYYGITITTDIVPKTIPLEKVEYETSKLGIKFSNIVLPSIKDAGKKVIGYYIVRNKVEDNDKTIVDSGLMTPCLKSNPLEITQAAPVSNSLLLPEISPTNRDSGSPWYQKISHLEPRVWSLTLPTTGVKNTLLSGDLEILNHGTYELNGERKKSSWRGVDVNPDDEAKYQGTLNRVDDDTKKDLGGQMWDCKGLSAANNSKANDCFNKPTTPDDYGPDSMALKCIVRDNPMEYSTDYYPGFPNEVNNDGGKINVTTDAVVYNMEQYESSERFSGTLDVTNTLNQKRTHFIEFKNNIGIPFVDGKLPYVTVRRRLANPYESFHSRPYYKETNNMETEEELVVFNGDSYIFPHRMLSVAWSSTESVNALLKAVIWKQVLALIGAVIGIIVAVVVGVFTYGTGALAVIPILSGTLAFIGAIVGTGTAVFFGISEGVANKEKYKSYLEKYTLNSLDLAIIDEWVAGEFAKCPNRPVMNDGFGYRQIDRSRNYECFYSGEMSSCLFNGNERWKAKLDRTRIFYTNTQKQDILNGTRAVICPGPALYPCDAEDQKWNFYTWIGKLDLSEDGSPGNRAIMWDSIHHFNEGPSDDQFNYFSDCLTNIWFESTVNMGLRNQTSGTNEQLFLSAPNEVETGQEGRELIVKGIGASGKTFAATMNHRFWLATRVGNRFSTPTNVSIVIREAGNGNGLRDYTHDGRNGTANHLNLPKRFVGSFRTPVSEVERVSQSTITVRNENSTGKRSLIITEGVPYDIWAISPDFHPQEYIKPYFHIDPNYSCCQEAKGKNCNELFPHRFMWSEQSFQEEVTDNYQVFKENDYKEILGETGEIMNLFKLRDKLYIHTREALWEQPKNYQQIVTDEMTTYIGTGDLYAIPPKKIVDDSTGMSAGTDHRESCLITPYGYFFVCERQRKVFMFDGEKLHDISNRGINSFFSNNTELLVKTDWFKEQKDLYPFDDNPSNPVGCGFITVYDNKKNRVIFTKKDFGLQECTEDQIQEGVCDGKIIILCIRDGKPVISTQETIDNMVSKPIDPPYVQAGKTITPVSQWRYTGNDNCRLNFERDILKEDAGLPNDTDIIIHMDMSGSFQGPEREQIRASIKNWYLTLASSNVYWTGNLYFFEGINTQDYSDSCKTQRTWATLKFLKDGGMNGFYRYNTDGSSTYFSSYDYTGKNIFICSFVNENACYGCDCTGDIHFNNGIVNPIIVPEGCSGSCLSNHQRDYNYFVTAYNEIISSGGSFRGILYPINIGNYPSWMDAYIQYCFANFKHTWTESEFDSFTPNPLVSPIQWGVLKDSLVINGNINPYIVPDTLQAKDYNWALIPHRAKDINGVVLSEQQFQQDVEEALQGSEGSQVLDIETTYIEGIERDFVGMNNSWTLSYSIDKGSWVSFHSYLPSFYFHMANKFFSWKEGQNIIWKHPVIGEYQKFYGEIKPFIIDYISNNEPLITKIYDSVIMQVSTQKFIPEQNAFVDVKEFFNKIILYNTRQCTGELDIKIREEEEDWMLQTVDNSNFNEILANRTENSWKMNEFRDIRVDYSLPIFKEDITSVQEDYFIDKVLNMTSMNFEKNWQELESFRDKYLGIRLIFSTFVEENNNTKFNVNFSVEKENISYR